MNSPPAARPTSTPTRADGQRIELRTHIGDLVRTVPMAVGEELFTAGLVNQVGDHLCLKPHVRWIPARGQRPSGRPTRDEIANSKLDPEVYRGVARQAIWRGCEQPHIGKGALGRAGIDRTIFPR
jgi:hypothetical protein